MGKALRKWQNGIVVKIGGAENAIDFLGRDDPEKEKVCAMRLQVLLLFSTFQHTLNSGMTIGLSVRPSVCRYLRYQTSVKGAPPPSPLPTCSR